MCMTFHFRFLFTKFVVFPTSSINIDINIFVQFFDIFWSATYRTDSDIYVQRMLKLRDKPIVRNYSEIFRKKTKLVSWAVSNCKTPSKRRKYVEELNKYIDIDIYSHILQKARSFLFPNK
jgi:hypothetical protein